MFSKEISTLFPTYIFKYKISDKNFNENIVNTLDTISWYNLSSNGYTQTVDNHLEKNKDLKNFFSWVSSCLADYKQTLMIECVELKIILAWANKAEKNFYHPSHVHPNSFLSGVYCISPAVTSIFFEDPRQQLLTGIKVDSITNINNLTVAEEQLQAGNLLIFPSWLSHFVESKNNTETRLSIAFNIMPSGIINNGSLYEYTYR